MKINVILRAIQACAVLIISLICIGYLKAYLAGFLCLFAFGFYFNQAFKEAENE